MLRPFTAAAISLTAMLPLRLSAMDAAQDQRLEAALCIAAVAEIGNLANGWVNPPVLVGFLESTTLAGVVQTPPTPPSLQRCIRDGVAKARIDVPHEDSSGKMLSARFGGGSIIGNAATVRFVFSRASTNGVGGFSDSGQLEFHREGNEWIFDGKKMLRFTHFAPLKAALTNNP